MRNVADKDVEKSRTYILCSIFFFENREVYDLMRRNIVEKGRPQTTIWLMHIACWIPKPTKAHSEYVIIAFPLQQCNETASILRYTYAVCLVKCYFGVGRRLVS
jgi:hypothetical protein